jgi:hypothetical protein
MGRSLALTAAVVVLLAHAAFTQTGERQARPQDSIAPRVVPAYAPTQPWRGKVLPDGQPALAQGIWGAVEPGTRYIDRPPAGVKMASRVVDPPDGLIPYQPWALELKKTQDADLERPTQPHHVDPQGRCLNIVPRLMYYLTPYEVHQSRGLIVFQFELEHLTRVIPLDGRPHLGPAIKLWLGDARGRWDGNTLLVDTTNFNGKGRLSSSGDFYTSNARLRERMTYLDPSTMTYEATIDDPSVFTRPWTIRVAHKLRTSQEAKALELENEIVEYMCYEGEETAGVPSQNPATRIER